MKVQLKFKQSSLLRTAAPPQKGPRGNSSTTDQLASLGGQNLKDKPSRIPKSCINLEAVPNGKHQDSPLPKKTSGQPTLLTSFFC